MNKYEIVKEIVRILSKSNVFTPGGITIYDATKYLFDYSLTIDQTIEKIQNQIKFAELRGNKIDIVKEKEILNSYFNLISQNKNLLKSSDWLTDKEKNEAFSYLFINPFSDEDFQLAIINLIFLSHKQYVTLNEIKNLNPIDFPEDLLSFVHDDMLYINSTERLENAYYYKDLDKVIYPAFEYKMKNLLDEVNLSDCDIFIRPRRIVPMEQYSPNFLLTEERMFGVPFNKENIKKILSKESGEFKYTFFEKKDLLLEKAFFIPLDKLEYYIEPNDGNLVSLSLEDVIDYSKQENVNLRDRYFTTEDGHRFIKHRYLHAIFDRETLNVKHCDMSWLIYFDDNIEIRRNSKLKERKVRANYKIKMFRIDAKKDGFLPFELFQSIGGNAMDGNRNPEIYRFFNGY